ncbi:phospholipid scramblase-related protein [Streptomyces sp. NBC_01381]|uniref:phospholipid scramblase-related protein n=1 Tax=Streptomyces sp. NBC_01381 TaxID=2903845 RepID=UPI002255227C|nr:phospholipid scramblase-related protein [Streptomyces sp. NBC_01381]MCX4671525.1 phospholipid scramblase-related protein [Streptomyces sp. NBC_01381]
MTTHSNTPAGWYPDPQGAPQLLRWWDGSQWTQHTNPDQQAAGQPQAQQVPQQAQPVQPQMAQQQAQYGQPQGQFGQQQAPQQGQYGHPQQAAPQADPAKVQRQVQQQAGVAPSAQGGGTLFTEPVLVVNQKAKLIELTNEYSVMDQSGNALGSVVQVGQSTLKKVARFVASVDQFMTHKLEIRDAYGQPVLQLTRPRKFMKSRVIVERPDGQPIGEIVQQNMIGKINFAIMVNGQQAGAIKAENWRAWNFSIVDHADNEVARITKTWEGLAKTMFTTADNYVLQIHYQLPEPLLSLVVATALTVDTALKQDSRGFG